jgi:hypothetical protein
MVGLLLVHLSFSHWLEDAWRHRLDMKATPNEPQPV